MLRLTPHADTAEYRRPRLLARPAGTRPISRMTNDDEQEKAAASQHDGESRLGRADRARRHRGGAVRALHHHAGPCSRVARYRWYRALADAVESAGNRRG